VSRITDTLTERYLQRLGLDPEPPSADALRRLHRAQVERVPYETLWIHLGDLWSADPVDAFERVATTTRGGFCFQLNGAFGELLRRLGYDVTLHVGGVHGPGGPDPAALTNHLVLTVAGHPTDDAPAGQWYVDVGLGDALHDPLPLVEGTYQQGPFTLGLTETQGGVGDWHLAHDPAGGFTGMAWQSRPAPAGAFDERNRHLSTSPESGFVQVLTVQRRDATGVDVLRGLVLKRIGAGRSEAILETRAELLDALGGVFDIDVDDLEQVVLDDLWQRTLAAHEAWESAGRP
jgi:N-hydroxyarylamine O-acetyltransferase